MNPCVSDARGSDSLWLNGNEMALSSRGDNPFRNVWERRISRHRAIWLGRHETSKWLQIFNVVLLNFVSSRPLFDSTALFLFKSPFNVFHPTRLTLHRQKKKGFSATQTSNVPAHTVYNKQRNIWIHIYVETASQRRVTRGWVPIGCIHWLAERAKCRGGTETQLRCNKKPSSDGQNHLAKSNKGNS